MFDSIRPKPEVKQGVQAGHYLLCSLYTPLAKKAHLDSLRLCLNRPISCCPEGSIIIWVPSWTIFSAGKGQMSQITTFPL